MPHITKRSVFYWSSIGLFFASLTAEISSCNNPSPGQIPHHLQKDSQAPSVQTAHDTIQLNDPLKMKSSTKDDTLRLRHHDRDHYFVMPCSKRKWDDYWQYSILRVDIFSRSDSNKIQTVAIKEPFEFTKYYVDYQFIMDDFNFDGYGDFSVRSWEMANFNSQSKYWLFDPSSGKFIENKKLDDLWDATFDHKEREVHSWENMTDSPVAEVKECYTWKNGKLYLQHSEECQDILLMDSATIIMSKRINGKLETRSRKFESADVDQYGHVIYDWEALNIEH